MCNRIITEPWVEATPIPPTGKGWKIFRYGAIEEEKTAGCFSGLYDFKKNGWVVWDEENISGDGFCFFTEKEEAERLFRYLKSLNEIPFGLVLKEIKYKGGLQERFEDSMITCEIYRIALCKQFKISTYISTKISA